MQFIIYFKYINVSIVRIVCHKKLKFIEWILNGSLLLYPLPKCNNPHLQALTCITITVLAF